MNLTKKEIEKLTKKEAIEKKDMVEDILCNTDPVSESIQFDHFSKIYDLLQSKVDGEF